MWRINSVEEITTTTTEELSDEDEYSDLPFLSSAPNPTKVPFPEAGIDFIDVNIYGSDTNEDIEHESAVKWTDFQNWEENWLFKKRKKCENKSDIMLGYMAMILAELPVCMLIPNPIDKIRASVGDKEVDELSELSEHLSYGSLEFSDDESEYESDVQSNEINGEKVKHDLNTEIIASERVPTIVKTTNSASNELMGTQVITTKAVGNKNKPNVKLITKVPNYLPKELRDNENNSKSDPHLVLMPGDACVQTGILVQFCCRAKGTKPLLFSWFKNDTILKTDENFRIFQSGEENVLEIKKTSPDLSAQYSCVVYNSCGYHWCDFTLKVEKSNFISNKMSANKRNLKPKGVSTTNPKHEKFKTRPIVVQRTWAERVAELEIYKYAAHSQVLSQSQKYETNGHIIEEIIEEESDSEKTSLPTNPIPGTIAEREHKKWENPDIEWKDNPYSIENLNSRIQSRAQASSISDESSPEVIEEKPEEDIKNSFLSSKSKDLSRYKKEYYIKQTPQTPQTAIKDETLRSFDENEYWNTKYFDISSAKRKLSEDVSQTSDNSVNKNSNETESEVILSDSDAMLPSVKDLVHKFALNEDKVDTTPKLVDMKRKNSFSDTKLNNISRNLYQTTQSNFKVHSLTARSLTKEFREMSHLNLPRTQRNRMDFNGHNGNNQPICHIESESSDPSTACSPTNEGYASDESNSSSTMSGPPVPKPIMNNKSNGERKFSRSILRRASYWEKRCEQGLISDSSVNEDFPPMEKFAN